VDGSIIWRLGGKQSTFTLTNFNFSSQHDALHLREQHHNRRFTIRQCFERLYNSATYSSGMLIAINNSTNRATLLKSYVAPNGGLLSVSQTFNSSPTVMRSLVGAAMLSYPSTPPMASPSFR
jgi:hypothetical protein